MCTSKKQKKERKIAQGLEQPQHQLRNGRPGLELCFGCQCLPCPLIAFPSLLVLDPLYPLRTMSVVGSSQVANGHTSCKRTMSIVGKRTMSVVGSSNKLHKDTQVAKGRCLLWAALTSCKLVCKGSTAAKAVTCCSNEALLAQHRGLCAHSASFSPHCHKPLRPGLSTCMLYLRAHLHGVKFMPSLSR